MCNMTTNAALLISASSQPRIRGTRMRCADDEMGRNSVSPWITPMTMAWTISSKSTSV